MPSTLPMYRLLFSPQLIFLALAFLALPLHAQNNDDEDPDAKAKAIVTQANTDYLEGKLQTAWDAYRRNSGDFIKHLGLSKPDFIIWLVEQNILRDQPEAATQLAQAMLIRVDQPPPRGTKLTDEEKKQKALLKAELQVLYGDIAALQQDFARARAQYQAVQQDKALADSAPALDAALKSADIDRITKQYDNAILALEALLNSADEEVQTEAYYLLALTKFDQEEFDDSRDLLKNVFRRQADHPEARILQGELNLKTKKLIEATEVRVGLPSSQRLLVPGKPLRVTLEDNNLAVVGKSELIEVEATTSAGDREVFKLLPFGESRTQFEGDLPTAMDSVKPNDGVLQVFGGDTISYDFSEDFRNQRQLPPGEPVKLTVRSNSEIFASSGEILSEDELAQQRFERMIEASQAEDSEEEPLSARRPSNQIKPGNPIYVRVIDPDQNTSADKDQLFAKVFSSSGDSVARVALTEVEPYSGIFEGSIPTSSAPATAIATTSAEGSMPFFAISAGDYPTWQGAANSPKPRAFTVDLKDQAELGQMKISSPTGLTRFRVETSLNGEVFNTVASYPEASFRAWQGHPAFQLAQLTLERR